MTAATPITSSPTLTPTVTLHVQGISRRRRQREIPWRFSTAGRTYDDAIP